MIFNIQNFLFGNPLSVWYNEYQYVKQEMKELKKRLAITLIFILFMGIVFPYMPSVAEETGAERITMTELYNKRASLMAEQGMTVTISSAEEMDMWSKYSNSRTAKNPSLSGVTVELLQDIRYSPYTFSYNEMSGRFGIYSYGELKAAYDVERGVFRSDFSSDDEINLPKDWKFWDPITQFDGTFDGNGHYIAGLQQNDDASYFKTGMLFIKLGGCVKNLKLSQCYLSGLQDYIGGYGGAICGVLHGTIENCHTSDMYISSNNYQGIIGGLVGVIQDGGMVTVCSAETYMHGNGGDVETNGGAMGGLVGEIYNGGTVTDCSAETHMYGTRACGMGGLVGIIYTDLDTNTDSGIEIKRNYVSGLIHSNPSLVECTGGIIGKIAVSNSAYKGVHEEIEDCVSEMDIQWQRWDSLVEEDYRYRGGYNGGIVGYCESGDWSILNCENRGTLSGGVWLGGIAGKVDSMFINQCRNAGNIRGNCTIGGIVGESSNLVAIANTENMGDVTWEIKKGYKNTGRAYLGGMVGNSEGKLKVSNSFVDGNVTVNADKINDVMAGGIIGYFCNFEDDSISNNLCAYMTVDGENGNILCGSANIDDPLKLVDVYYPGENVDSQCESLNEWVRTKCEGEYNYAYIDGKETFPYVKWILKQGVPRLQLEYLTKPEKPDPIVLPELTPPPTVTPKPATPTPTITPKPTVPATLAPTQTSTAPDSTRTPLPITETKKPAPSAIPAVTGIKIKVTRDAALTIQWKPTAGVSGYSVYRSNKKKSGYREISSVPSGKQKWRDRSVKEKHTYYYRVAAYRIVQGRKVYGVNSNPQKIKVKLRAPVISLKKKKSGSGQRYIQIKIRKKRVSQVELWVKKGKKPFRRMKLHGVAKKKKTNTINLRYKPEGKKLHVRARIIQKKKKKRYKSYYSKTKRIRI